MKNSYAWLFANSIKLNGETLADLTSDFEKHAAGIEHYLGEVEKCVAVLRTELSKAKQAA